MLVVSYIYMLTLMFWLHIFSYNLCSSICFCLLVVANYVRYGVLHVVTFTDGVLYMFFVYWLSLFTYRFLYWHCLGSILAFLIFLNCLLFQLYLFLKKNTYNYLVLFLFRSHEIHLDKYNYSFDLDNPCLHKPFLHILEIKINQFC